MSKITNKVYEYFKYNFNIKEFIINILIISIILFMCLYNLPYVIYRPGGTISLSNRIYLNNNKADVGNYNMAYVSVINGSPLNLLIAFFNKNWDIKKTSDVTYKDVDFNTTIELEKLDLQNSINVAKYVAFKKADKKVELKDSRIIVSMVDKNAKTNLKALDEIIEVDGKKVNDLYELKEYINTLDIDQKIKIKVLQNKKEKEKYAKIIQINDNKLIGVGILNVFNLETEPSLEIKSKDSEAGSSGGLMLSLTIYDALVEKDLTKGRKIAGTGTIEIDGNVGEIAGVKYKLLGAEKNDVDIFFVAKDNYKEAKRIYDEYDLTFKLVKVSNIDDAIEYLNKQK